MSICRIAICYFSITFSNFDVSLIHSLNFQNLDVAILRSAWTVCHCQFYTVSVLPVLSSLLYSIIFFNIQKLESKSLLISGWWLLLLSYMTLRDIWKQPKNPRIFLRNLKSMLVEEFTWVSFTYETSSSIKQAVMTFYLMRWFCFS